ncbi:hypothetical protein N7534_000706 [Penicillium rubens]|nr:hypothetical protein N7534_000706 [Penicillium rubens]
MPSNLRRLAADHAALHRDLPPYYLQPGHTFSQGLWELHLKMPDDYPKSPPKATFKTKIWHPNMEELTGAVCVDTLKRDWQPNLTLRDVLVTISCLLIYPNPDSALNASAGALMQENYDAFAHQAKLMTSIHAPIPTNLRDAVAEAKVRGEETGTKPEEKGKDAAIKRTRKQARTHAATTKKTARNTAASENPSQSSNPFAQPSPPVTDTAMSDSESDDPASASKENDPTLSPSPVHLAPPSPRKTALGKRPLSVLSIPYPEDSDADMMLIDSDNDNDAPGMTSNERNITANTRSRTSSPLRKTPKLSLLCGGVNASGRLRDEMPIFEDLPQLAMQDPLRRLSGDGKENRGSATARGLKEKREYHPMKTLNGSTPLSPAHAQLPTPSLSSSSLSGSSTSGISKKKAMSSQHKRLAVRAKPRIGIRRL